MNWKQHILLGMVFFGIFYAILCLVDSAFMFGLYQNTVIPVPMLFIAIPVGLYASVVPDVDIRTSHAFAVSVVLIIVIIWLMVLKQLITQTFGLLLMSTSMVLLLIPRHRKFFHTVLFAILFSVAISLIFLDYRMGILIFGAVISHIIGDMQGS